MGPSEGQPTEVFLKASPPDLSVAQFRFQASGWLLLYCTWRAVSFPGLWLAVGVLYLEVGFVSRPLVGCWCTVPGGRFRFQASGWLLLYCTLPGGRFRSSHLIGCTWRSVLFPGLWLAVGALYLVVGFVSRPLVGCCCTVLYLEVGFVPVI